MMNAAFMRSDEGCVWFVVGLGILVVFGWFSRFQARNRESVLAGLGQRWYGRLVPGSWFSQPRLEIKVDGIPGEVTFHTGGKRQGAWTKVHFNWSSPHRLRITPEGFTSWLRSLVGGADTQVGDPAFDATYWIESSDSRWTKEVLTAAVRRGMLKLREESGWLGTTVVTVDLGPAGLVLKVERMLVDETVSLERFVELAILILAEARGAGESAGIVIAAVETKAGSECPVCGHAVRNERTCPQCRTPHHEDCWKYMGGCAIFGCGARRTAA
jgi:hypothetical protein